MSYYEFSCSATNYKECILVLVYMYFATASTNARANLAPAPAPALILANVASTFALVALATAALAACDDAFL